MQDQEIMAAMAGQQMPPEQGMPPQGGDPRQQAAMQAPQPAKPNENENIKTGSEKALDAAGAKEGGELDPVVYKVKFGDSERELNEQQIRSTFERYASMNHKWQNEVAPYKPVLELAQRIMMDAEKQGIKANPQELAELMQAATMAYAKNPQMGSQGRDPQSQGQQGQQPPMSLGQDDLSKWEEENAVSLPPGYKDQMSKMGKMEQMLGQMMQAMMAMSQGQQGQQQQMLQGAQQMNEQAGQQQSQAIRQTIGNNLAMAQQQMQLPDDKEQDFFQFAFARGYTIEDFIDPQLTIQVAQDFRNNMNSPEMDRLKAMAQRRQAFTGMAEGAPAMAGGGGQGSGDQVFDSILGTAMSKMQR